MISSLGAMAAMILTGCAAPAPGLIQLPTTGAIRAPLSLAQIRTARAISIGQQETQLVAAAATKGIAAGSEEARELSSLVAQDSQAKHDVQDQLSAALYQSGALDREQAAKQKQIDALAADDHAQRARNVVLQKARSFWRDALLLLLVADFVAGAPIQLAMHAAVRLLGRLALAFAKHLIAFWPLLLAAV